MVNIIFSDFCEFAAAGIFLHFSACKYHANCYNKRYFSAPKEHIMPKIKHAEGTQKLSVFKMTWPILPKARRSFRFLK